MSDVAKWDDTSTTTIFNQLHRIIHDALANMSADQIRNLTIGSYLDNLENQKAVKR